MSRYANIYTKPILKWVGGKTQMLGEIIPRMPNSYNKYIEPFFGGGALFFAVAPQNAIVSDVNPELVNLYRVLTENSDMLLSALSSYENTREYYYRIRDLDYEHLSPLDAACRTLYLNKTCFNGMYRVNKDGKFNSAYGRNKLTMFVDHEEAKKAASLLQTAVVMCADYHEILLEHATDGDFVFLDPPYVPISKYSDFTRYTKEQFGENDQRNLAHDVKLLSDRGCKVMLTNSNHPLIHELYADFRIEVFETKRLINVDTSKRTGQDVIITNY